MDEQSRERIKQEIRERGKRRSALIERINTLIRYGMIDAPSFSTHTECYTELDMISMIYDAAINAKFSNQVTSKPAHSGQEGGERWNRITYYLSYERRRAAMLLGDFAEGAGI